MKKNYFFRIFVFAVIAAFVTITSCKDYDDDINRLDKDISSIKSDYASKLDALKTELNSAMDAKVKAVSDEIAALKTKVEGAATQKDIDDAKAEILGKVVTLETFNTFKTGAEKELGDLKTALAKAATKDELNAAVTNLATELGTLKNSVDAIGVRVTSLESNYAALLSQHTADVQSLTASIAAAKSELTLRIANTEAILKIADGKSQVIEDINTTLADQLKSINANKKAIEDLQKDLNDKYKALDDVDKDLQEQITKNGEDISAVNLYIKDTLKPQLAGIDLLRLPQPQKMFLLFQHRN